MIRFVFRNLKSSELLKHTIRTRLKDDMERFPELEEEAIRVTVSMENSPSQAGPDLFRINLRITQGRYRGVSLEKTGTNFYIALADLNEALLERLNRFGDKQRDLRRKRARQAGIA